MACHYSLYALGDLGGFSVFGFLYGFLNSRITLIMEKPSANTKVTISKIEYILLFDVLLVVDST